MQLNVKERKKEEKFAREANIDSRRKKYGDEGKRKAASKRSRGPGI